MNGNIRIAKQLIKLAKILVSFDEQNARGIGERRYNLSGNSLDFFEKAVDDFLNDQIGSGSSKSKYVADAMEQFEIPKSEVRDILNMVHDYCTFDVMMQQGEFNKD